VLASFAVRRCAGCEVDPLRLVDPRRSEALARGLLQVQSAVKRIMSVLPGYAEALCHRERTLDYPPARAMT
jgi:hypothetical protein